MCVMPVTAQNLGTAPMAEAGSAEMLAGVILVKFADSVSAETIATVAAERGCTVMGESPVSGFHWLQIPADASPQALAEQFAADPDCEWASPEFVTYSHHGSFPIPPDDPFYSIQTHLQLINIEDAWADEDSDSDSDSEVRRATRIGSEDVVVAVLDSGVAFENRPIPPYELVGVVPGAANYVQAPDLAETHFVAGFDFIHGDPNPNDDRFHGTAVTATITQDTNNGIRTAGVAPGVSIMPVKVLFFDGNGTLGTLLDGINFATANGADVINMSLGFPSFASDPSFDVFFVGLDAAIQNAYDSGVVLVASTGNDGGGVVSRPALNPNVIAVGASNFDSATRTFYSQDSTAEAGAGIPPTAGLPGSVEIVAPVGDFSDLDGNTVPDAVVQEMIVPNDPENFGTFLLLGTSFSAPQVAAAAALLLSGDDDGDSDSDSDGDSDGDARTAADVDALREVLRRTAVDIGAAGADLVFGAGQLDLAAALDFDDDSDSD